MMTTQHMTYALISIRENNIRYRKDVLGTVALEKYTDNRIVNIYKGKQVDLIYKVYNDSRCILIYGKETET